MNSLATPEAVKGDFSGNANIDYMGGEGRFYREEGKLRMEVLRGDIRRKYDIEQTIGSRFYQYYIGKQIEGPEPVEHRFYKRNHVLPFGYWLSAEQWVPIVHVRNVNEIDPFTDPIFEPYAEGCSICHTTLPVGDWFLKKPLDKSSFPLAELTYSPRPIAFLVAEFLQQAHSLKLPKEELPRSSAPEKAQEFLSQLRKTEATQLAATLGISCEACHFGGKEHSDDPNVKPKFFPTGSSLLVYDVNHKAAFGRNRENINWICARCHSGRRPLFARGMSTWNSVEYSDATRGGCYSELTCIHCHDPHKPIGPKWPNSPAKDDSLCISCHLQYSEPEGRVAHTHHLDGSEGGRCMNCHMPKLNEGLEDIVRTHTIFSPNDRLMLEANQPNACNLCHLDKPITWTISYLKDWYGTKASSEAIGKNYSDQSLPVGTGWMKSDHSPTRMVAAWMLSEAKATWALPELIGALDDGLLLNRQFAQVGFEKMMNVRLEEFGYRFTLSEKEREQPLARLRVKYLKQEGEVSLLPSDR